MVLNQENVGILGGGDLVGIHRQRIHVAYVESDASEVAVCVVRFVFRRVRAEVDLGGI